MEIGQKPRGRDPSAIDREDIDARPLHASVGGRDTFELAAHVRYRRVSPAAMADAWLLSKSPLITA
jgi:hypothetical protein